MIEIPKTNSNNVRISSLNPYQQIFLEDSALKPLPVLVSKTFWIRSVAAACFFSILLILYACSSKPTSVPIPAATPTRPVDVVIVSEPTAIPDPTATHEPLPETAILFSAPDSETIYIDKVKVLLEELLTVHGIELITVDSLTPEDLGPHVRLVTAIGPVDGISELIAASTVTHFVLIGSNGLSPQNNLSIISTEVQKIDYQAFMAGVIAAVVTPDWRIGVISTEEISSQAFINGGVYFCGLCRQVYPPFYDDQGVFIKFPLRYIVLAGAGDLDWQNAADFMTNRGVKTVYLSPEAHNQALINALEENGLNIIGSFPNVDNLANWVATIHYEPIEPLRQMLPNILQGSEGRLIHISLDITDINTDIFSRARQKLAFTILEELEAGFIFTGIE
jgi:hypothetical protein